MERGVGGLCLFCNVWDLSWKGSVYRGDLNGWGWNALEASPWHLGWMPLQDRSIQALTTWASMGLRSPTDGDRVPRKMSQERVRKSLFQGTRQRLPGFF